MITLDPGQKREAVYLALYLCELAGGHPEVTFAEVLRAHPADITRRWQALARVLARLPLTGEPDPGAGDYALWR